jgi:hypothetical protein
MARDDLAPEVEAASTWIQTYVLPLAALVLVVAIVSLLVLTGVAESDQPRVSPSEAPTTLPTVEVVP